MTDLKPDLREARRLLDCGMHLVPLHAYEKRPFGNDWNAPSRRVKSIDATATGYGLPLTLNKLCSVDPDNWPLAQRGMKALGFDLEQIMAAGVRTKSTRPNSGGRSAFAEEPDLSWLAFRSKATGTVIEFRAFSPNLQDCVPGVVYHDKTGALCTQTYANCKRLDDAPGLPDALMDWWQRCSTDIDYLHDEERKFFAALGVAPMQSTGTGRNGCILAYPAPGYRGPFNAAGTVESILERHGYTQHGDRWAPATATGAPSVRPIKGKDDLWQSDHASDPLKGTFDRWIAHVVLDHQGDLNAAIAQEQERQQTASSDDFDDVSAPLEGETVKSEAPKLLPNEPQEVSIADLDSFAPTPPDFWADEILPADVVTLLGAHGGTGKTTLALYAAVCLAMGLPFLGKQTKAAKVLFYSAEDDAALLRWRLASVCLSLFVDPVELSQRLSVVDASEADSVLFVEASRNGVRVGAPTAAFKKLVERMAAQGTQIVILDNASDVYGADEINRVQVRTFIRLLAKLVRPNHGAVLLLAHVDKLTARVGGTQGYSGSTAWHNSVRSRLFLSADEKTGDLLLEHQKSNRGKRAESMRLVWRDGLPVLEQEIVLGGALDIKTLRLRTVLALMDEFYRRGEFCSTSPTSHTNAFKVLSGEAGFPKVTKPELWQMLRDAERQGLITREDYLSAHRNNCQRWKVKAFSQSNSSSLSSPNENSENTGGTDPLSSPVGGMGGEDTARRTQRENESTPAAPIETLSH